MACLLCQIRCSVQRIKAVVSISQNLSLVSLSPSARPWGWKQFKHISFWRCFQSWRSYKELVPPYESLVCWHLFDQLLLFGCTWTQSPLIKMTSSTNKMIKCHLSLVSESPSAAPGRSRWSRSLTPLCWTQGFVKLRKLWDDSVASSLLIFCHSLPHLYRSPFPPWNSEFSVFPSKSSPLYSRLSSALNSVMK